jgi:hypothetical protein
MAQRSRNLLITIVVVSVLLRMAVALYLGNVVDAPPLLTDQRSYHALGARLIAGDGFSFPTGWYPFTPANTPTAHWSFLYSLFVAGIYGIFGSNPLAVRLAQAVLAGILLPLVAYRFAKAVFVPPVSSSTAGRLTAPGVWPTQDARSAVPILAAALTAIYAYFVLYAATLMTEALYTITLLWSLELTLTFARRPTLRQGLFLGISLGIATLLRQSILPWVAVLSAWLMWVAFYRHQLRHGLQGLLVALAVIGLMVLPFTIRNYRVYGSFLLLNSNAGYAMYSAQNPMHGVSFQTFTAASMPDDLHGMNEAQMDRELMRRGIGFVIADPIRYLRLSLSRVPIYFEFWPAPGTTLLHALGRIGSFGLFLPFMLYGFWTAIGQARVDQATKTSYPAGNKWRAVDFLELSTTPLALCVLFVIFYSTLHVLTWAMPRYRLPVDAVALCFAAFGLAELIERTLIRRHTRVARWLSASIR